MLYFGALCSPWYFVGSVLLICLIFYVVLWCFMFTVVFGGVRVAHLFSFLCCDLLVRSVQLIFLVFCVVCFIDGVRVAHLFSFRCCVLLVGSV